MRDTLVGTGSLIRLALRRDRWLLPVWVLGFAVMAGSSAAASADLFPDIASRVEAARTLNGTASMVALFGRVYDPTSIGALSMIKYTAFMTAVLAVVVVVVMVRHTRADEESGRLELLGGGRLGRNAPLTAALTISVAASLLVGLVCAGALAAARLPVAGSLAFGLGWAATGLAFSAVAGVTAQIATTSRAAIGMSSIVIAVTYVLRAVGDLTEPGPSFLSWLSPIGWNQQVRAYAGDRWWVLLLPLALFLVLVPVAFVLRARRDLGAGLREERPGPARGSIDGVRDLAVRLQDRVFVAWLVAFVLFGVVIGSLVSGVNDFFGSSNAQELIRQLGGSQALTDAFLSAEISIMGILAAVFGIASVNHLRSEETSGHAESLLATTATRTRWATSHVALAVLGTTLLMLATGVSVGVGAALALGDAGQVARVTALSLAQAPGVWVMSSIAVGVFGWLPRLTAAVWVLLVGFVALGQFGDLWHAPQWLMDLSPFQHAPLLPLGSGDVPALVVLTLVAAVIGALGYAGWRRRDLTA
ncbi:MAG TPA: ABC transporter permease [Candidatus Angelobacter sp.]|nr:ABC transporter permease [Candidatus Angelobacter sp.]